MGNKLCGLGENAVEHLLCKQCISMKWGKRVCTFFSGVGAGAALILWNEHGGEHTPFWSAGARVISTPEFEEYAKLWW